MTSTAQKTAPDAKGADKLLSFEDSRYLFNRELSWLEFNRRVLEEALDDKTPLLERLKFLSIFSTNLDEFFMIRVSGLKQQISEGDFKLSPDGLSSAEQYIEIRECLLPMLSKQMRCLQKEIIPKLSEAGIKIISYHDLDKDARKKVDTYFLKNAFGFEPPRPFDIVAFVESRLQFDQRGNLFAVLTRLYQRFDNR